MQELGLIGYYYHFLFHQLHRRSHSTAVDIRPTEVKVHPHIERHKALYRTDSSFLLSMVRYSTLHSVRRYVAAIYSISYNDQRRHQKVEQVGQPLGLKGMPQCIGRLIRGHVNRTYNPLWRLEQSVRNAAAPAAGFLSLEDLVLNNLVLYCRPGLCARTKFI